jgi:hypothetical protein
MTTPHDLQALPVYAPGQAPAELLTARQLSAASLPTDVCPPAGWLDYGDGAPRALYDHAVVLATMLDRDRAEASAWAAGVLADPGVVLLDTETTGLSYPRLVEIGVLDINGETLLDTLVNPGSPIPPEATAIHGITDQDVADAPGFGELLPELTRILQGRRVVICNAAFDTRVLATELDYYERDLAPRCGTRGTPQLPHGSLGSRWSAPCWPTPAGMGHGTPTSGPTPGNPSLAGATGRCPTATPP